MTVRAAICFFAHPDDELLVGGILRLLTTHRIPVTLVCATRGEGGEMGEPPVVAQRGQLGAAREAELRCAAQALGVRLVLLDYIDPTIGDDDVLHPFAADVDTLAGQFVGLTRQEGATLVLTHGADGEYGHPAHQLVHRAVLRGIPRALPNTLIYSVAALVPNIEDMLWNRNEPAHLALDIRPWAQAKLAAMQCHVSQHPLFRRNGNLQRLEDALRMVESVRRQWPPTHDEPLQDDFAALLRTSGAWEPKG